MKIKICLSLILFGLLSISDYALIFAKPPPWAPAHGYRRKFFYYPQQKVYYDPATRHYFWLDAGVVKVGIKLPDWIHVNNEGVTIELPHEKPIVKDFK